MHDHTIHTTVSHMNITYHILTHHPHCIHSTHTTYTTFTHTRIYSNMQPTHHCRDLYHSEHVTRSCARMRDNDGTGKFEPQGGPPNGVARGVDMALNLISVRRELRDCSPLRLFGVNMVMPRLFHTSYPAQCWRRLIV